MFKNLEGARLGIFVFIGTALLVLAIFLIGNKESLFQSTIEVRAYFSNIEGLREGAPVQLSGMNVGAITGISLVEDSLGLVEVKMRIEDDVQHLIRLDSQASIGSEGLVGKKIVEVSPGSPDAPIVQDGGRIQSENPISMDEIIKQTQGAIAYFESISKDFAEITSKINRGEGTIGKLVNNDQLYYETVDIVQTADTSLDQITRRLDEVTEFVLNMGESAETIMNDVDSLVLDLTDVVQDVKQGKGILGSLISNGEQADSVKQLITIVRQTALFAREAAQDFAENMEALKHNWLFKHYFEERGYWDKSEFENELDKKIETLREQNRVLERKLEEIQEMEDEVNRQNKP